MKVNVLCNICSSYASDANPDSIPTEIEYKKEGKIVDGRNQVFFQGYKCPKCFNQITVICDFREN